MLENKSHFAVGYFQRFEELPESKLLEYIWYMMYSCIHHLTYAAKFLALRRNLSYFAATKSSVVLGFCT